MGPLRTLFNATIVLLASTVNVPRMVVRARFAIINTGTGHYTNIALSISVFCLPSSRMLQIFPGHIPMITRNWR
jgi:hypothetical protein